MGEEQVGTARDHLANERTHLAWLRTGTNVMVVGLAVARFADDGELSVSSVVAGGILLLTGAVGIGYGTLRYRALAAQLRRGVPDVGSDTVGPTVAAVVLLVAAIASTVVLLVAA